MVSKVAFHRRQSRVRTKLKKVSSHDSLRLSVFRSNLHIYAQLIDDQTGHTVATASSLHEKIKKDFKNGASIDAAKAVGELLASTAKNINNRKIMFDRGGNIYHGRIKALAESARAAGLNF